MRFRFVLANTLNEKFQLSLLQYVAGEIFYIQISTYNFEQEKIM